jgi:hypothetical protein
VCGYFDLKSKLRAAVGQASEDMRETIYHAEFKSAIKFPHFFREAFGLRRKSATGKNRLQNGHASRSGKDRLRMGFVGDKVTFWIGRKGGISPTAGAVEKDGSSALRHPRRFVPPN